MESILFALLTLLSAQVDALSHMQPITHSEVQQARSRFAEAPQVRKATVRTQPAVISPTAQVPSAPSIQPVISQSDERAQIEQYVLEETNARRAQNALAPFASDSGAAAVARAHSEDMLSKNYFSHTNLSGCSAGCRLSNAGYAWKSYGENIHWMSGYNLSARDSARKIVSDWMNSSGHRANILGSFTYAGVGIAVEGTKIYSTTIYTTK